MTTIEVTPQLLKKAVGKKVEVVAFGISYRGRLEKVDVVNGTVQIVDQKGDTAVFEIERIEEFKSNEK